MSGGPEVRGPIGAVRRRVRRDAAVAVGGAALAAVPAVLLVAWALGGASGWNAPSPAPLALEAAGLVAAVAAALVLGRRWVAAVDEARVAAAAEDGLGLAPGTVRGVLELGRELPPGVSASLFRRAESEVGGALASATPVQIAGAVGARARRQRQRVLLAFSGLTAAAAVLGFLSPERSRAGWAPLLDPVAHLSPPPLPPLAVEPGDAVVPRGGALDVRIGAPGRSEVVLRWRAAGDVPRQRTLVVEDGAATSRLAGIDGPLVYWAAAPDGARSETFRVTPLDPLLVSDLVVDVVYPSYLERSPERFEGEVPPLEIPVGTEIRVRGRSTRRLEFAGLRRRDGETRVPFEVTADRFAGRWTPRASGVYDWALRDEGGGEAAALPPPLELTVTADEAPEVAVTFPGTDTVLSPDLRQPVVADARDDNGLRGAELVSWRVSSLGDREEPVRTALPVEGDPDRALLRTVLDASERRLLPGDTLFYFVRVTDDSPRRQTAVSRTYRLRLPSMDELRARADEATRSLVREAEELARSARDLEEGTRDLSRRASSSAGRQGGSSSGSPGGRSAGGQPGREELAYREAERARQVLERQESLVEGVEAMAERARELERAMEAAGLRDPELQARLGELRELFEEILTPELKRKLAELRQALDELDPDQVQQALEQLAREQEEFRQRVEQSLELLRRAALEQRMNALAQEARELAAQQEALARAMQEEPVPGEERAAQQAELTERGERLNEELERLQAELAEQGEQQAAGQTERAREDATEAQERMAEASRQAAEAARQAEAAQQGQAGQRPDSPPQPQAGERSEAGQQQQQGQQQAGERSEAGQQQQQGQQQASGSQQRGQQGEQRSGGQQGGGDQGMEGAREQARRAGQSGARAAQQLQQAAETLESARQSMAAAWKQEVQETVQQATNEALALAERQDALLQEMQEAQRQGGQPSAERLQSMRAEQGAVKQGLEALGRNLSEAGQRSAMVSREVGAALGRAMLSMQQTLDALEGQDGTPRVPSEEAAEALDALNRLALALLENGEQIARSESGTGLQQALEQLSELAQRQGALNGQTNSLLPLDLGPRAMAAQLRELARQQREIADRLGGVNDMVGGREDVLGRLDALAREADALAREMAGGRLSPETLARQERLFHRLLDAGRTLEREEVSDERVAERPGAVDPSRAGPLDPALLEGGARYPAPDPETLRGLAPAYRRLILEYFDRLNRTESGEAGGGRERGR